MLIVVALVLVAAFIIFPPVDFSYQSEKISLSAEGTEIQGAFFGREFNIRYNYEGKNVDYKTLHFATTVKDPALITKDTDTIRQRLEYFGSALYDVSVNTETGELEITTPSWVQDDEISEYVTGKGELIFTIYTFIGQEPQFDPETGEEIPPANPDSYSEPLVNSLQFLPGDIKSVSYSSLQTVPTVEITFNKPAELAARVPQSIFRSSQNQQVYLSIDKQNIGEAAQTVYQLNGDYPSVEAFNSPWELKTLTLAIDTSLSVTATDETSSTPKVTPEKVYRLLNFGQVQGEWQLTQADEIPAQNWQASTLLLIPLFSIVAISGYLAFATKRIDWFVPTVEGFAFTLFVSTFFVRVLGIALSPTTILTIAIPSAIFSHMVIKAAYLTRHKIDHGATVFTSMKASLAEVQNEALTLFGLLLVVGIIGRIPSLSALAVVSGAFAVSIFVLKDTISRRAKDEKIVEEKVKNHK